MKHTHTILGAVCAGLLAATSGAAQAVAISGQGAWESTLQGRDLDGNLATFEAYYDTALDITWLADTHYYGNAGLDWYDANAWVASLDINGVAGWRLPTVTDTGTPGCDFAFTGTDCGFNVDTATGEMARMFFETLGNESYYTASGLYNPGYGLTNTGPFLNLEPNYYWTSTIYALNGPYIDDAWFFEFDNGNQASDPTHFTFYAWAVHDGDVGVAPAAVPVPAAAWLFGSGLLGLIGVSRTRRS